MDHKGVSVTVSNSNPLAPKLEIIVLPPASSIASLVALGSLVKATIQPPPPAPVNLAPSEEGDAARIKSSNSGLETPIL